MRRKFALLIAAGAVLALALPAISMATEAPLNAKFEIVGGTGGPRIRTSLGSCTFAKITGQIPSKNEPVPVTPVVGTCTTGASMTVSSPWLLAPTEPFIVSMRGESPSQEGLVLRFASLPGCKLSANILLGVWINSGGPAPLHQSGYLADSAGLSVWHNDGGTCALNGKTETISYEDLAFGDNPAPNLVNDLTNPAAPIQFAP
jgi:hypothetical protein